MTTVQQCVSQYRNINFSTKVKVSVKKNIFKKIWKKSLGTLYMIITMYLNMYAYYSVPKQTFIYFIIINYLDYTTLNTTRGGALRDDAKNSCVADCISLNQKANKQTSHE